jgi:hypothetical protein
MRANEFLIEKKITPRDFYKLDRLNVLISRLENGEPFKDNDTGKDVYLKSTGQELRDLKALRKMYDADGNFPGGESAVRQYIPAEFGGIKLSSLFKDAGIGGKGGSKGNEEGEDTSSGNIGPALEVWKAAAIYTRLVHRETSPVTFEDIQATVQELDGTKQLTRKPNSKTDVVIGKVFKLVPDFNKKIKDTLSLKIDVGLGSYQRAAALTPSDKKLWGSVQGVIKFVNENNALKRYTQIFAMNGRVDPVKIALVGGEGLKTDIQTTYIDPATNTSKPLSSLNFSIKAKSSKFHQSSGTTNEGVEIMFTSLGLTAEDAQEAIKTSKFEEKIAVRGKVESPTKQSNRNKAIVRIFKIAAQKLDQNLKTVDDKGEKAFVINFLNTLKAAFTGKQNLIYVDFDPRGTYKKLNPHQIGNLASIVDLESRLEWKNNLYLYVYDAKTNNNLFHLRLQVNKSGRLTILFELDKLIEMTVDATGQLNAKLPPSLKQQGAAAPVARPAVKFAAPQTAPYPPKPVAPPATQPITAKPALKVSQQQLGAAV